MGFPGPAIGIQPNSNVTAQQKPSQRCGNEIFMVFEAAGRETKLQSDVETNTHGERRNVSGLREPDHNRESRVVAGSRRRHFEIWRLLPQTGEKRQCMRICETGKDEFCRKKIDQCESSAVPRFHVVARKRDRTNIPGRCCDYTSSGVQWA